MSEKSPTIYTFQNHEYDLKITYGFAIKTLKADFGIDLTNILADEVLDKVLNQMFLNDDLPLRLWTYYVSKHLGEQGVDDALDDLTPTSLQQFKDTWWAAVRLFIGPLRGEILSQILKEAPTLFKKNIGQRLAEQS